MMYRVLIADDEPWVAYGITKLIDWETEGYVIAGEAFDGLSALQFIREEKPDVVISDIRMPGLDGIELMEAVRKEGIDAEVIVVSGYAEFDYAKQAILLGAFDYLLKQIDRQELLNTVRRLRAKLEGKKRSRRAENDRIEDWFELMESDPALSARQFMLDKIGEAPYPNYQFISFLCQSEQGLEAMYRLVMEIEGWRALSFRTGRHKLTVLVNHDLSQEPHGISRLCELSLRWCSRSGISSVGEADSSVSRLYQEADIAVLSAFSMPDERIIAYREASIPGEAWKLLLQMEAAIKEQKPERIGNLLDQLVRLCTTEPLFIDQIAVIYGQVAALILKYYPKRYGQGGIEFLTYDQIARLYTSPAQLFGELKPLCEMPAEVEGAVSHAQIRKIMDHIESRLTEDLSLSDMARQLNLSVGYLSLLFKRETGMTYSEYVTSKRLELAKSLLREDSLSIQEIAERTGYKDYYHFNKLFKKHVGVTPSKYRKL